MATSRSLASTSLTTRSPIVIVPAVGSSSPAIMRSAVDLPQPDGPSTTRNSSSAMSIDKSSTAVTPSNCLETWSSATRPMAVCSSLVGTRSGGRIFPLRRSPEHEQEQRRADDPDDRGDNERLLGLERNREVEGMVERPLARPEGAERDGEHRHGEDVLVALLGAAEEEAVLAVVGHQRNEHERAHPAVGDRREEPEEEEEREDELGERHAPRVEMAGPDSEALEPVGHARSGTDRFQVPPPVREYHDPDPHTGEQHREVRRAAPQEHAAENHRSPSALFRGRGSAQRQDASPQRDGGEARGPPWPGGEPLVPRRRRSPVLPRAPGSPRRSPHSRHTRWCVASRSRRNRWSAW